MAYQLFIFPTPLDAHCELRHDSGLVVGGISATHPSGRLGQSFDIPVGVPNGNGAALLISAPDKTPIVQRGIVYLNDGHLPYPWLQGQKAAFAADDFTLVDSNVALPRLVPNGEFLVQEIP